MFNFKSWYELKKIPSIFLVFYLFEMKSVTGTNFHYFLIQQREHRHDLDMSFKFIGLIILNWNFPVCF